MKKSLLILSLMLFCMPVLSQTAESYNEWEILTFVASFQDDPNPNIAFKEQYTDTLTNPLYPVMFKLPDKENSSELIYVDDYVKTYGEIPYFWNEDSTAGFLQTAISDFFLAMFKRSLVGTPGVQCNVKITYVGDPNNQESKYWVIPRSDYSTNFSVLEDMIKNALGEDTWNSYCDRSKLKVIMLMVPLVDCEEPHGTAPILGNVTCVSYRPDVLNETTIVVAHELGHLLYGFLDVGKGKATYIGKKDGQFIGASYSSAWPFDLMGRGYGFGSQYQLYGLSSFHANDLMNYYPNVFVPIDIEEGLTNNKTIVRLKSPRELLTTSDLVNGVTQAVTIPIENIDFPEDGETNGNFVTDQKFLIEYRNGERFDNNSAMYRDGENTGVLISHIINDESYSRIIDIECATPLPENSRIPSLAWDEEYASEHFFDVDEVNGLWYFGKKINDWMDDYAPNSVYTINGGKSAWWKAPTALPSQALPEDFFNDTDRNAFTPTTRPNTRSWKDNETNIAVFIDKIEGDYADLTIYRNYHSNPLTASNAKELPDGTQGLEIRNEGYIGENFFVGVNMRLYLGGGGASEPKTTLIPNTNMHVENKSKVVLLPDSKLLLENSTLTFNLGSVFIIDGDNTAIGLHNSYLNFEYGSDVEDLWTSVYNISISGESSFYMPEFEMKGASVLSLNEDSKFTLVSGTNFTIPAGATLIMNRNSELVVESGSNLIIDPNAIVQMEEGAKITIQNGVTLTLDGVTINGTDWAGINTEPGSTLYASYCSFTGAETAVSGTPAKLSVSNCTFTDCSNGINLTACNDLRIIRNTFTGKGEGTAVTVTQSNGWINNNTASNFYKGLNVISCSPLMVQNTITNNVLNGVYTAGYNTYPQMYNPIQEASLKSLDEDLGIDDSELNNTIYNNGINYVPPLGFISKASQLYMVSDSNIYLNEGINNIYSDGNSVPCIMTLGLIPEGEIPRPILIYAPVNYWGSNVNDSFFALSEPYYIDYSNYSTVPYGSDPLTSSGGSDEQASKILSKALEAELDGKYDKAIKTYEKIIEKYPDSSEALVAYAKLPDSYTQESLSIEPLIEMYDMNIAEENSNKKFFKELKVSSHIKAKNYDTAIALSEEMKLEAGTEDEIILCDIDIAIANMLKNAENKGKGRNESTNSDISALLDKLTGGEEKGESTDITDAVIPATSKLYQNYPNPFNPVTQIRFDIAKTGNVKLSVYNINGQKVAELANGVMNAGIHSVEFDGSNLNSGVYYYTLETYGIRHTQKMILTK